MKLQHLLALSLPFVSSVWGRAIPVLAPVRKATVCNGRAELCDRQYSNVTFIGSHDSFAFSKFPLALSRDQEEDIPTQLSLGVRLLQAQAHMNGKHLNFCHTNCFLFDGGKVVDYLKKVKTWLDKNPSEVLTLLFTNPGNRSITEWGPLFDQSGISQMAYVPPHVPMAYDDWPTLGEMIESGKRVVVFLDKGADTTQVNYILPEFQMIWETQYSVTDPSFPCKIDRMEGPLMAVDHMYLINHSLNKNILPIGNGVIISDPGSAKTVNSVNSIVDHANRCAPFGHGRAPNFVLLDWVNQGQAFQAAKVLNGLA